MYPATEQQVIGRIFCHDSGWILLVKGWEDIKGAAFGKDQGLLAVHSIGHGMGAVELAQENGTGTVEFVSFGFFQDVSHGRLEFAGGQVAGSVQEDQGATLPDKFFQVVDSPGHQAADIIGRHVALAVTVEQQFGGIMVGNDYGVILGGQVSGPDVGVVQAPVGKFMFIQDKPGPAFIFHGHPGLVDSKPGSPHFGHLGRRSGRAGLNFKAQFPGQFFHEVPADGSGDYHSFRIILPIVVKALFSPGDFPFLFQDAVHGSEGSVLPVVYQEGRGS